MNPNVFVCLPGYGYECSSFTTVSLFNLAAVLNQRGIGVGIGTMSYPDIAEARNNFLTFWYDKMEKFSHCLFVDNDMQFKPDLVLDMLAFDKAVVGTFYRKRTDEKGTNGGHMWTGEPLFGDQNIENGFMKVHAIGFGVTLVSRKCVDALIKYYPGSICTDKDGDIADISKVYKLDRLFRFFDKIPTGKFSAQSEDYSFCQRVREAGMEVWATIAHPVGHIGSKVYEGRFWDDIQQFTAAAE